jgi:hypothetical protein
MVEFKKRIQKNKINSLLSEGVFWGNFELESSKNFRGYCIVEGTALEVPNTIYFPEVLCEAHATVVRGQSIQWRQLSLGGRAKGRILQHRRRNTCVGVSCMSPKIQLPGMDSVLLCTGKGFTSTWNYWKKLLQWHPMTPNTCKI